MELNENELIEKWYKCSRGLFDASNAAIQQIHFTTETCPLILAGTVELHHVGPSCGPLNTVIEATYVHRRHTGKEDISIMSLMSPQLIRPTVPMKTSP